MASEHEIRSTQFPFDMAGWCTEKSEHAITWLARLVTAIRRDSRVTSDLRDDLLLDLYSIIYDSSKLFAFSCGGAWTTEHPQWIFELGTDGYEKVAVAYGLLKETSRAREGRQVAVQIAGIRELLSEARAPARTLLHERLANAAVEVGPLARISDMLENVTQGVMEWPVFTAKAALLLAQYEAESNATYGADYPGERTA